MPMPTPFISGVGVARTVQDWHYVPGEERRTDKRQQSAKEALSAALQYLANSNIPLTPFSLAVAMNIIAEMGTKDGGNGYDSIGDTNKGTPTSPTIDPKDVGGKTPEEIDKLAGELGLQPKGLDPKGGRGAYIDPVTVEQRILVHGDHTHVSGSAGNRLDINGNRVPSESPAVHLPIGGGR